MRITIQEASTILNVSKDQISDWIESGDLPAIKINDQYHMNRSELLEWATAHNLPVGPEVFRDSTEEEQTPSVSSCLERGGVFHGIAGDTRELALRRVIEVLPLDDEMDREMLLDLLIARESLGTTAVGHGIAIPHVRSPIVLTTGEPLLSLCYLDQPVDFGAPDGQPVYALFALICPTIRVHLQMLAKLALLLRNPEFREAIRARSSRDMLLFVARRLEEEA